jgi:hypothetical protein
MQTITLRLPRPHEAQRQILDHPARFKVIDCGRRFGKTELFCNVLLNGHHHATPGALAGYPVAYVSLTHKNVRELWLRLLDTIPAQLIKYKNDSIQYMELVTGGIIECWTFERFINARGRAYAGICLDEAAQTRNLKESWQEVFIAMLLDFAGWAVIGSTPQGFNFFYELWQDGQNPEKPDWMSWQFTTYDNPYIANDEIEKMKAMVPELIFDREYMAKFNATEGLIYPTFSETGNVSLEAEYSPDHGDVYWGVDDGYAHGEGQGSIGYHPRVFLQAQLTPVGGMNVFDEYVATLELQDESLGNVLTRPYPLPVLALVDSAAAELRGRIAKRGIMSAPASHRISEGIKVVRRFICDGNGVRLLQIHPRCKNLIRSLLLYRTAPNTKSIYAGEPTPLKIDEDESDALRYLLFNFR